MAEYQAQARICPVCYDDHREPDWLTEHDQAVAEKAARKALLDAADDAATSFGWKDPGDADRASRWLRARAERAGGDHG